MTIRTAAWGVLLALLPSGCAPWQGPRIDPSGQNVLVASNPSGGAPGPIYRSEGPSFWGSDASSLFFSTPNPIVAPVGSEVVLVASVRGNDASLRTNERVEWTIAPGGVGYFLGVGQNGISDWLFGVFRRGKVNNTFVIGTTSRSYLRLTRGTPTTADDVCIKAGQAWVSLTSPVEGATYVTAFASEAYAWDRNKQTTAVYWLDAQWQFPPPAISNAGGRSTFTTRVFRPSDQTPCVGWRVAYAVLDGPAAGFGPGGTANIEVLTDGQGLATAEMVQRQPAPGTNRIQIQVIRPADAVAFGGRPLVAACGSTLQTWTAPQLALRKIGPASANTGTDVRYQITLSNPGDLPADDVVLADDVPDGTRLVGTDPPAEPLGRKLQWRVGRLAARETRVFNVTLRAERPGAVSACAEASAANGLRARECITTQFSVAASVPVGTPLPSAVANSLDLKVTGPDRVSLGTPVTFEMLLTNRGAAPTGDMVLRCEFDPGLEHAKYSSPMEHEVSSLGPGQAKRVTITFQTKLAGRLSHRVRVTGPGGVLAQGQAAVLVEGTPGAAVGPKPQDRPVGSSAVRIQMQGPSTVPVGETAEFVILVTNTSAQRLTGLKIVDQFDPSLTATQATDKWARENKSLVWRYDELGPNQTLRIDVHCRCDRVAPKVCNKAAVMSQQGAAAETEACLEVRAAAAGAIVTPPARTDTNTPPKPNTDTRPPATTEPASPKPLASKLSVSVADLHDPLPQGKELTYEIRIANGNSVAVRIMSVVANAESGLTPVEIGTSGPTAMKLDRQQVRFDPVARMESGETLTYRVRARADKIGSVSLRVEVSGQDLGQPIVVTEATKVLAPGQ